MLMIRTFSRGVQRRAGLILTPIATWVVHELAQDADSGMVTSRTLLALAEDPGVTVEIGQPDGDGFEWIAGPTPDELKRWIADREAADRDLTGAWLSDLGQDVNTVLPTVEPTLESEGDTHTEADEVVQSPAPDISPVQAGEPENLAPVISGFADGATIVTTTAEPESSASDPEIPARSETKPKARKA